jgi:anti-sigma-K factor RskA
MNERHVDDLVDAYALGALESDEVDVVETHLGHCARCQALAAAARNTAEALYDAVPLVVPPSSLRAQVLAAMHKPADILPSPAAETTPPGARAHAGDRARLGHLQQLLRGLLGPHTSEGASDPAASRLAELLTEPECAIWEVGGTPDAPAAHARLVGVPDGRGAVLLASGLRALPPDQAYQVWFLRSGQPSASSLFDVPRSGRVRAIVRVPARLSRFETVAVTPEPAAGSTTPTGPIVLVGQLTP